MPLIQPLSARGLSRSFGSQTVLQDIDLTLAPGELTALVGPSGAGKTTLLRLFAGMERPDHGEIWAGPTCLSGAAGFVPIERRRIGLVFQDFALFPHLTVLENVMFGLRSMPRAARRSKALQWVERMGLSARQSAYPHHLSGGEQQRTAIARALAPEPVAILLDEPFSGLDPAMRDHVRDTALGVIRQSGVPALLVTHDASEAMVHADQIAILSAGRLVQSGPPASVYRAPTSRAAGEALGPLHEIETGHLPSAWADTLPAADRLHYRPEAIRITEDASVKATIRSLQLAGPVSEIVLELASGQTLYAACQIGSGIRPGETVGLGLDPTLCFVLDRSS